MNNPSVAVVIVTYGRRWYFLAQVLQSLQKQPFITDIILVDNCSRHGADIAQAAMNDARIRNVQLLSNTGSSKGFRLGLETAVNETTAKFFWLLDDDNAPTAGSLKHLLAIHEAFDCNAEFALLSLRKSRLEFLQAVQSGSPVSIGENSFHGFHLRGLLVKVIKFIKKKDISCDKNTYRYPIVSVGYAPYGGLFLHRSWIDKIGYPDERFVLYADDHEFTNRIIQHGGTILLCAYSEVRDLENSCHWNENSRCHLLSPVFTSMRLYYSVRNRVYLEKHRFVSRKFIYILNLFVCLFLLFWYQLFVERRPVSLVKRLSLVVRAISDGWWGRLGERAEFEL